MHRHDLFPIGYGVSWCLKCERHFEHSRNNKVKPATCYCAGCKRK